MNRRGRTGVFGVCGVADLLKQTRSGHWFQDGKQMESQFPIWEQSRLIRQ